MVDIRPLLFINALLILLLVTAGITRMQADQSMHGAQHASAPSEAPKQSDHLGNQDQSSGQSPEMASLRATEKQALADDAIFKDEAVPPHKDAKLLAEIDEQSEDPPVQAKPLVTKVESKPVVTTGHLTVRSNVYNDVVLINGKPYGPTALDLKLSPGTYMVEVTKSGYRPWRQSVSLQRGATVNLNAKLEQYTTVNFKDGTWENGVQTGEGRYQDGARIDYQGSFVNGRFHGVGSARYADGSKYQGEWFEGIQKGDGTYTSSTGDTYVGQFSDNEFNGDGTLTKATGDIYTGYWINGALNGQGSLTTRDGLLYVGGFSDNLFHGSGSLTYPDGGHYEGSFSNGLFHGKGIEVYANGKKYVGQFIEGLYHGKGEMLNPNGSKISGTFKDGEPFGKVTLTTAEGEVFTARSTEPGVCYRPKSYRATACPVLDGW